MIFGIGTDIIEVSRIAEKLEKGNGFLKLVYSETEIQYCNSKANPSQHFAGTFAAKEAFLKALRTGMYATFSLKEIEIINVEFGAPEIHLSKEIKTFTERTTGNSNFRIHVSISHTSQYASATVIIELF